MRGTVVKRINRELRRIKPPPTKYELVRDKTGRPIYMVATGYRAWRKALKKAWRGLPRTTKQHAGKGNIPGSVLMAVTGRPGAHGGSRAQ